MTKSVKTGCLNLIWTLEFSSLYSNFARAGAFPLVTSTDQTGYNNGHIERTDHRLHVGEGSADGYGRCDFAVPDRGHGDIAVVQRIRKIVAPVDVLYAIEGVREEFQGNQVKCGPDQAQ